MPVFLSHSFQDEAVYGALRLALLGAGIELWDREAICAGESLSEQLRGAIESCNACVLIATRRSVESAWCNAELGAFWGAGKKVILFMVDPDLAESVLPPQFKGTVRAVSVHKLIEALKKTTPKEEAANRAKKLQCMPRTYDTIAIAFSEIIRQIKQNQIQVARAEFIQHSSEVAHHLIEALLAHDVDIELYLQSYDTAVQLCGEEIRSRIKMRATCYPGIIKDKEFKKSFVLQQYQSPASLNGARLEFNDGDSILLLGWYVYSHDGRRESLSGQKINGGDLPCIKLHSTDHDFKYFQDMFDKQKRKFKSQGDPMYPVSV